MELTNKEKKELRFLKTLIRGTPIKINTNSFGNITISSPGFPTIKQKILSSRSIIQYQRKIIHKKKLKATKLLRGKRK